MGFKSVIGNIKNKGIAETYRIHAERKREIVNNKKNISEVKAKRLEAAKITKAALEAVKADDEKIERITKVILDMEDSGLNRSAKLIEKWNKEIRHSETKESKDYLRRLYLKELIPAAYEAAKEEQVEDKIVFLHVAQGMSESMRYTFEKIEKEYPYKPVLCNLNRDIVSWGERYLNAIDFAKEAANAKAIMVTSSSPYLGYINIRPETKVVQLWHGCGVIKHLGLTASVKPGAKKTEAFREFPEYNKYDLVTICSEEQRWIFEDFMGKEKGDPVIQAVGMSRTDEFFEPEFVDRCFAKLHRIIPASEGKKVILYAPTYRGRTPNREAPKMPDIAKFAEKLADDYILIIKQHQTVKNLPDIPEEYRDHFAYDMTRGKGMNINELMTVADIMISDYSSVVFEYSLFERPLIFYLYDLEEYQDTRGMYYSYEELAEGGEVFMTDDEMVDYIANIEKRFDKSKIAGFRGKFMSACDGHALERIMSFVSGHKGMISNE